MTEFTIAEGRPWHCGQMARMLRIEQYESATALGLDPHHELRQVFDVSAFRRAWLIDGKLAALGGVSGPVMSQTGIVWLALSKLAKRFPVAMVREARRQLGGIMATKTLLTITVAEDDDAARRLAVFLGFVPRVGFTPAESRFGRKSISEYFTDDTASRIRYGSGSLLVMYYAQQDAA